LAPGAARAAASRNWPPFVLVAGLLLIGLVAADDHLFSAAGHRLAAFTKHPVALYLWAMALVAVVTAVLNLDTSVAFLTPVLIHTARRRRGAAPLVYGCLLLSNAGSLLLPGSNLTNLIVLGHLHLSGGQFLVRMAPAWAAAVVVTVAVVGLLERRSLGVRPGATLEPDRPKLGLGLVAVAAAVVLVLVLRDPALPVLGVGIVVVAARRERLSRVWGVLGVPILLGLFGVAVALGGAARVWNGPAHFLSGLGLWPTGLLAAASTVVVNNLPAASLLSARVPPHPYALLVGLNIGPNLFVTGSLAWILWLRAAGQTGERPSIRHATRLGLIAAPLALVAALGALDLAGRM
ncbi:MAG: hypothetical protein J2P57_17055, partial [Acidimicrobiaceae bacterium]|nr:hypothetical protein [Acidimicrobiaceae bacterium]